MRNTALLSLASSLATLTTLRLIHIHADETKQDKSGINNYLYSKVSAKTKLILFFILLLTEDNLGTAALQLFLQFPTDGWGNLG